jgi:hypothetical protein
MTTIHVRIPEWVDRICAWPAVVYRLLKYKYTYRRIYLGDGRYAKVDPALFYRLNKFGWIHNGNKERPYAVRFVYTSKNKRKIISMHREIMGFPEGRLVDHENGDSLDNRIDNLRVATDEQNAHNKGKTRKKTSSKYIGVYFDKNKNSWIVRITNKYRKIYVGTFKDELAAAKAHDTAARRYHKEFARLNFVQNTDWH